MIVYDKHGIRIECADILDVEIREKVDLIVTSPPYNVGIEYDG
jgi:DNA modification methylase